jgi:hypothetical protein
MKNSSNSESDSSRWSFPIRPTRFSRLDHHLNTPYTRHPYRRDPSSSSRERPPPPTRPRPGIPCQTTRR